MTKYFWYRTCPVCEQGRLLLFKDLTANRLYLHCEECEWGWHDPERAADKDAGFLTLDQQFEAAPASVDDIQSFGWERYAVNEFDEP